MELEGSSSSLFSSVDLKRELKEGLKVEDDEGKSGKHCVSQE